MSEHVADRFLVIFALVTLLIVVVFEAHRAPVFPMMTKFLWCRIIDIGPLFDNYPAESHAPKYY